MPPSDSGTSPRESAPQPRRRFRLGWKVWSAIGLAILIVAGGTTYLARPATILPGIRAGDPKGWNLADMPAFAQAEPYKRYKIPALEPGEIRDVIEFLL